MKYKVIWAETVTTWFEKDVYADNKKDAFIVALENVDIDDETGSNNDWEELLEVEVLDD